MNFPLVQEEADATERGVEAEGTPKLFQLGVLAVLMILEGLSVAGSVCAVFALIDRLLLVLSRMFGQHVIAKLIFALASISTDLTHQCLGLMS